MEVVILVAAVASIAAFFTYLLIRLWRIEARREQPPPLVTVLESPGTASREPSPEELAVAMRRCTFCSGGEACQQKLAAGEPIPDYCPNTGFLASLGKLRAT